MLRKSGIPQTFTPAESNIDTKNDGALNVSPFKYGYFGYPAVSFSGVSSLEVPLYMVQPILPPCLAVEALMEFAKGEVKKRHIHTGVTCEGFR